MRKLLIILLLLGCAPEPEPSKKDFDTSLEDMQRSYLKEQGASEENLKDIGL